MYLHPRTEDVLDRLRSLARPDDLAGMRRVGINTENALGLSLPAMRSLAKELGKDHPLALALWSTGIHEARILAGLIDDPALLGEDQAETWVKDFNSWDVCDLVTSDLFEQMSFAREKAFEWSQRPEEFVKRAGFVLMAAQAFYRRRDTPDEFFYPYLEIIVQEAGDGRNYVKKAVNWALRNIGKRNAHLNARAVATAEALAALDSRSARWIARDALRELTSEKVQNRVKKRSSGLTA